MPAGDRVPGKGTVTANPPVAVIMPTRGRPERAGLLRRALGSVMAQEGVQPIPIVVVNGPERDPDLCRELATDTRIRIVYRAEADLPAALRAGREAVDTEWFAELDDDDLLLPGALRYRLDLLSDHPTCDVVVTNALRRGPAGDEVQVVDAGRVRDDPLRALLERHWLLPGSYLCRTSRVGPDLFDGMPRYLENTYLAIRFATGYRFRFADRPTVVWHLDTPWSESKSAAYLLGQVGALERILSLELPSDVRAGWRRHLAGACHEIAGRALMEGDRAAAWRWHLRSLWEPGGWRFIPYTRRLVWPWSRVVSR